MPRLPSAPDPAAVANGLGVGAPTRVRVLVSWWEKSSSRPGMSSIPSSSYDQVPSSLMV